MITHPPDDAPGDCNYCSDSESDSNHTHSKTLSSPYYIKGYTLLKQKKKKEKNTNRKILSIQAKQINITFTL